MLPGSFPSATARSFVSTRTAPNYHCAAPSHPIYWAAMAGGALCFDMTGYSILNGIKKVFGGEFLFNLIISEL